MYNEGCLLAFENASLGDADGWGPHGRAGSGTTRFAGFAHRPSYARPHQFPCTRDQVMFLVLAPRCSPARYTRDLSIEFTQDF
jgi:hypothetical protein